MDAPENNALLSFRQYSQQNSFPLLFPGLKWLKQCQIQISQQKINSCKSSIDVSQEFWTFSPVLVKPEIMQVSRQEESTEKREHLLQSASSLYTGGLYSFRFTHCCGPYIKSYKFVKTQMSESQQPFLIHTSKKKESVSYVPLEQIKYLHEYL